MKSKFTILTFFTFPFILFADTICLKGGICGHGNVIEILENEVNFKKFGNSISASIRNNEISYIIIEDIKYSFDNLPATMLLTGSIVISLNKYLSERKIEIDSTGIIEEIVRCDPEYTHPELLSKYKRFTKLRNRSIILLSLGIVSVVGVAVLNRERYSEPYTFDETMKIEAREYYTLPLVAFSIGFVSAGSTVGIISIIKRREYRRRISNCKHEE